MTFSDNILPAMAAIPVAGFILREWICLMLLPSIEPNRVNYPPEKESDLERPKILIMKPDLSKEVEKAFNAGADNDALVTAIKKVAAQYRINNRPEANKPKLEIESNE